MIFQLTYKFVKLIGELMTSLPQEQMKLTVKLLILYLHAASNYDIPQNNKVSSYTYPHLQENINKLITPYYKGLRCNI